MDEYLERTFTLLFPLVVVLVAASVVGVAYARSAALLAILLGAALLGLERLIGERTTLDLAAGALLPCGALVGAAVGVFGVGVPGAGLEWGFVPLAPGVVALYAARRESPLVAVAAGLGSGSE